MNCDKIKQAIELALIGGRFELDPEVLSHLESCEICAAYYAELSQLRESLNKQVIEVMSGELDDITFENIIPQKRQSKIENGRVKFVLSGFRKWAWAPAAAFVIVLLLNFGPRYGIVTEEYTSLTTQDSYDWSWGELVSMAGDSGLWSSVVETFIENETEFDMVADEIPLDLEDALESLTDEELNMLYERIDKLNGSVS
ncbi:MAG: hypothetical protein V3W18_02330 [candidate division Zixibacteria bacterium]